MVGHPRPHLNHSVIALVNVDSTYNNTVDLDGSGRRVEVVQAGDEIEFVICTAARGRRSDQSGPQGSEGDDLCRRSEVMKITVQPRPARHRWSLGLESGILQNLGSSGRNLRKDWSSSGRSLPPVV